MRVKLDYILSILYSTIAISAYCAPTTIDNHIKVDQFGYRCNDQKIAVISNPKTGYNSSSPFIPGTTTYQVKRWSDDVTVFSGTITQWNGGATDTQSGDAVWWFDFSSLTTPGSYYVYDATKNVGSYEFDINDQVYATVLMQCVRMYFYQRCGLTLTAANAGTGWAHTACHVATQQDKDCRLYSNPVSSTSKVLSGGWHDAGDYNKYVNFAFGDLVDLLLAYEEMPSIWPDTYNIPESGNGVPDFLDEIKYELDWLLKMQQSDGSVLSIVGNACTGTGGATSPPSADANVRYYGPANTSAAFSAAAVFALAAIQYKSLGIPAMTTYATTLQTAAINAWNWGVANPSVTWYNNSNGNCYIVSGEQEVGPYDLASRKVSAASFLYVLTGNTTYQTFFDANYSNVDLISEYYVSPYEMSYNDALLYYSKGASPTASVVSTINSRYTGSITGIYLPDFTSNTDPYRAYLSASNYVWGSNQVKAHTGNAFINMLTYNLDATNNTNYTNAASGYVHYIHGVNPTAYAYLTNMGSYGASNSITQIFHTWFCNGSALWGGVGISTYGPAPGYLPGGPDTYYAVDGCCPNGCGSTANNNLCTASLVTPPLSQPVQKAYKDWNYPWPQDSWQVTEPDIGYQASWVRLLSKFVGGSCTALPVGYASFSTYVNPNNTVNLNWSTASEFNSNYFAIERSINSIDFDSIGSVKAAGNSNTILNYVFTDLHPYQGVNYYRLKQVDLNGDAHYTQVKTIDLSGNDSYFNIYPNPANSSITVESYLSTSENVTISMLDVLGTEVYTSKSYSKEGAYSQTIDLSQLNSGIYIVQLNKGGAIFTKKLVKE